MLMASARAAASAVAPPRSIVVLARSDTAPARVEGVRCIAPDGVLDPEVVADATIVIVDDLAQLGPDTQRKLAAYAAEPDPGRWMIVGARAGDLKAVTPLASALRTSHSGIALQPVTAELSVLGASFAASLVGGLKPGHGLLVNDGTSTPILVVEPDPA